MSIFNNMFFVKKNANFSNNDSVPCKKCETFLGILLAGFMSWFLFLWVANNIVLNHTWSMPVGIYIKTLEPIKVGSIVEFCGPKWIVQRGYALPVKACHGGSRILKHVGAMPGQKISVMETKKGKEILVDGKETGAFILSHDSKGQQLPYFKGGTVPEKSIFLLSTFNKRSLDSRYFGFVNEAQIIGAYKCLLCFDKPF